MKRGYGNFRTSAKVISLFLGGLFGGSAYALPQDWPCYEFNLEKHAVIEDSCLCRQVVRLRALLLSVKKSPVGFFLLCEPLPGEGKQGQRL